MAKAISGLHYQPIPKWISVKLSVISIFCSALHLLNPPVPFPLLHTLLWSAGCAVCVTFASFFTFFLTLEFISCFYALEYGAEYHELKAFYQFLIVRAQKRTEKRQRILSKTNLLLSN